MSCDDAKRQELKEQITKEIKRLEVFKKRIDKYSTPVEYGSHNYNTAQMSRVVDYIVSKTVHPHGEIDANGWQYWQVTLQEKDGTIWFAILNVAKSADGRKILYDVTEQKNISGASPQTGSFYRSTDSEGIPSTDNITENGADVNPQNSFSENSHKGKQLKIIQKYNPMNDNYHTGIRSVDDIKNFAEAMNDDESFAYGDFSREDAQKALKKGQVTIYSSHPIKQGVFVSTSYNMAKDYSGGGKIFSKIISPDKVAWINGDEGQFADIDIYEKAMEIVGEKNKARVLEESTTEFKRLYNKCWGKKAQRKK